MKIGRTALTVIVAGCALSSSALAAEPVVNSKGVYTASAAPQGAIRVVPTFRIMPNGDRIPVTVNPNQPAPRGPVVGYNNLDLPGSAAEVNVAYVQPGSYDGTNTSTQASIFGLGDGPAGSSLRAPTNATFTLPTDIVWNEYGGDAKVWPGGMDAEAAITEFSFITARQNTGTTERIDGFRILFFSIDGLTFEGGFEFTIPTAAGAFFFQQVIIDLAPLDPPLFVPREGISMVDAPPPAKGQPAVGVGMAIAGGDLVNVNFPTPESLVQVGAIDSAVWLFADGETGLGGPPAVVDPMFDMLEGVSYLDVLNTGQLVNWGFTSTQPGGAIGTRTMTHDYPMRLLVGDGTTNIGACVVVAGNFCFTTTEADCLSQGGVYNGDGTVCGDNSGACCIGESCQDVQPGICTALGGTYQGDFTTCAGTVCEEPVVCPCDFNDSGSLNSQDFFDFLGAFFGNDPTADFNDDGSINSQDFFDFLGCFFAPPKGCL